MIWTKLKKNKSFNKDWLGNVMLINNWNVNNAFFQKILDI